MAEIYGADSFIEISANLNLNTEELLKRILAKFQKLVRDTTGLMNKDPGPADRPGDKTDPTFERRPSLIKRLRARKKGLASSMEHLFTTCGLPVSNNSN